MRNKFIIPQRGLGMVEMLVALALSVGILTLLIQVFLSNKQSYEINESMARTQENARHAMETITQDARMAGHLGDLQEYWNIAITTDAPRAPLATVAGNCFIGSVNWMYPFRTSAGGITQPLILGQNAGFSNFNCISAAQAGSDVLSLHYVGPDATLPANRVNGGIYLISNLTSGKIFRCTAAGAACLTPADWVAPASAPLLSTTNTFPIQAATYYVDALNKLNKVSLQPDGTIRTDPIAEGVVSFQVQYGWDNNNPDNFPEPTAYLSANQIGTNFMVPANWPDWSGVRTIRVWLLLRTQAYDRGYSNTASITVADQTITPVAGYRYQLFVTTIASRNYHN